MSELITPALVLALSVFVWRLHASLKADLGKRMDRIEGRMDGLQADLKALQADMANVKERLTAVETTLALLIKGLHIEVSGKEA